MQLCDDLFAFLQLNCVFGSLQTTQLCISGELAGGGSMAVALAVGISDRLQVTGDLQYVLCVRCQVTGYR